MMFIRIKNNPNYNSSKEYKEFLQENAGKLVQVETKHLFNNQYNTERFRVMDADISEVINDAREHKGKCNYCGSVIERSDVTCMKHGDCWNYGVEWFSPKNTYFLRYPSGIPTKINTVVETKKFGSYTLTANTELFIISNARKTIKFQYDGKDYYVFNGLGYKKQSIIDIPFVLHNKLEKYLKENITVKV